MKCAHNDKWVKTAGGNSLERATYEIFGNLKGRFEFKFVRNSSNPKDDPTVNQFRYQGDPADLYDED